MQPTLPLITESPMPRLTLLLLLLLSALPLCAVADDAQPPQIAEIRALLRASEVDAAVAASERAVKVLAGNARVWWWAGRAYGQKAMRANVLSMAKWAGRTREAFEKAVALDPDHLDARFDLMSYYLMAPSLVGGGKDKASAQAAAIAQRDASMGKVAASRIASHDKQPDQAATLLAEALALDGDNTTARSGLASLAAQRKDWAAARAVWQAQLARDKHQALAHYQLGRIAALAGEDLEQGLAHLDSFLAADELPEELSHAAAHWRRGQLLDKLGRRDEAIEALQHAVRDPGVRELAEADLTRIRG
jgi:tetratricopeptide (TPR) repeat protein